MNDKIIERIRKMLRLANDRAATEGERDNALRMAHATMAKYNLDMASVEEGDKSEEPRVEEKVQFFGRPWARLIAQAVAGLFFCEYLFFSARSATKVGHGFVGKHSNAVTAALLAEFVVKSIIREGKKRSRELGDPPAWYRSFCWGASEVVRDRIAELRAASEAESATGTTGKEIVLASVYQQEKEKNQVILRNLHPSVRKDRRSGRRTRDFSGVSEGAQYGATIPLNTQIGGDS